MRKRENQDHLPELKITTDEVMTMTVLVASLDPEIYSHPKTKALIWKLKAAKSEEAYVWLTVTE